MLYPRAVILALLSSYRGRSADCSADRSGDRYAAISYRRRQALPHVLNDAWRLTFVNNANACLLFAPVVFFFEGTMLWEVRAF